MDLDDAEALILEAVRRAFQLFLDLILRSVFADPGRPDWLVWPSEAWNQIVEDIVVPVAGAVYAQTLTNIPLSQVAPMAATFVGQDLPPVVDSAHIPDRAQQLIFSAAVAGGFTAVAGAGLLSAASPVWQPMLGVMAGNAGAVAVNAADFASAQALSDRGRRRVVKTWIARDDERTRVTHAAVDNSTVSVNDVFNVGGFPLRYPHDPFGPVSETVNCRCRLRFGEM